jgi:hypothetical protein
MKMVDVVGMTLLAFAAVWVVMNTQHSFNRPPKVVARAEISAGAASTAPARTGKRILVKRHRAAGTAAAGTTDAENGGSETNGAGGSADGAALARDDAEATDQDGTDLVIPLEAAQAAAAYVGVDPDANDMWDAAINDENESADVRRALIVSLNEAGFADSDHLTTDDLALIEQRMMVIEAEAPYAMDDANDAAFQEVYRDLAAMRERVMGR